MSRLRARCPDCRANTAVAVDSGYECHSCGRRFAAGLVRVPRAWGAGGEAMAAAASLPLPYPEAAVVAEDLLAAQTLAVAGSLPARPLVLGGCCCAHIGAVEGLATRHERVAVVWIDAHGDLNTAASSPSGNEWGMSLRMLLEAGVVALEDVVLVGVRSVDPPEREFIESRGVHVGEGRLEDALAGATGVYVALDADALEESAVPSFLPEPGGLPLAQAERLLAEVRRRSAVLGAGLTGLLPVPAAVEPLTRLCRALGL